MPCWTWFFCCSVFALSICWYFFFFFEAHKMWEIRFGCVRRMWSCEIYASQPNGFLVFVSVLPTLWFISPSLICVCKFKDFCVSFLKNWLSCVDLLLKFARFQWFTPDLETGRARTRGGRVHVVVADCQRFSFDGTHIVGPDCEKITSFTLV